MKTAMASFFMGDLSNQDRVSDGSETIQERSGTLPVLKTLAGSCFARGKQSLRRESRPPRAQRGYIHIISTGYDEHGEVKSGKRFSQINVFSCFGNSLRHGGFVTKVAHVGRGT
jgi:hypothetical protein